MSPIIPVKANNIDTINVYHHKTLGKVSGKKLSISIWTSRGANATIMEIEVNLSPISCFRFHSKEYSRYDAVQSR